MIKYLFKLLLIIQFIGPSLFAEIWTVDDDGNADFDTIQAAIDIASEGDEIQVFPGIYYAASVDDDSVVNLYGKAISLLAIEGSDSTIIDGTNKTRGIVCSNG